MLSLNVRGSTAAQSAVAECTPNAAFEEREGAGVATSASWCANHTR
jgi:hypothetical protein